MYFKDKVVCLVENFKMNPEPNGVLLCGHTCTGKSELIKTSAKVLALVNDNANFNLHWINVNQVSQEKLHGEDEESKNYGIFA
jgi:predicted AAA+ superfamily ATPase